MHEPSDLTTCIVTLITLEAFLIFVGLLMLDESIALMEHCITVTALPALLNVGMLLTEMHTCKGHSNCVNINTPPSMFKVGIATKKHISNQQQQLQNSKC